MQLAVLGNYTTLQHSLYLLIAHHAPGGGKQSRCQYHGKNASSPQSVGPQAVGHSVGGPVPEENLIAGQRDKVAPDRTK